MSRTRIPPVIPGGLIEASGATPARAPSSTGIPPVIPGGLIEAIGTSMMLSGRVAMIGFRR